MTDKELARWAKAIVPGDRTALLVFADAMEGAGDVRAVEVRRHAYCCTRGWNIADHIGRTGLVIRQGPDETEAEKQDEIAWHRVGSWPCVHGYEW